ncbi:MAG: hypothetical protein A3J66_00675 [Candidatus Magasanikbacteria bacterium RIFCSPHIGHO2_02_FULL_47_14]|uniref:DUF5671 domain-containing protein n=1 Tax=Candidatus Magasanikbacteria bacterium RIFCSPHIGHO2_02_FULL_47_14 TaxID=1798680 RepID=A0A1F6LYX7_9BACT|nr:MAG: hypothetical protein A3J66_00675 [Candidatus Magasanikbacteria bacterium RIFCSPHIGHO2_02_FULL_47_14]
MNSSDTTPKTSPKLFFLHLLSMITLYASAISFIVLVFQIVNLSIPDPLRPDYYYTLGARDTLRTALSFLIIMLPAYVGLSVWLHKLYISSPALRMLWIRRWLVYFTLFVSALIILISLVVLMNRLLDGELTLSFLLKLLSIFFVAGSIFGYYLWDIKKV